MLLTGLDAGVFDAMSVDSFDESVEMDDENPGLDVDSILVQVLAHLKILDKHLYGLDPDDLEAEPYLQVEGGESCTETFDEEPAEQANKTTELVECLQLLWTRLRSTIQDLKPVMSSDLEVLALLEESSKLLSQFETKPGNMDLETVASLRVNVTTLLETFRPIDLTRLYKLLSLNQSAGDCMQDKDVLLFLGESGAGKTTILQYLAGATFEEIEVDGRLHLQAVSFPDPSLKEFKTSSGTNSVTKAVQCYEVPVEDGKSVLMCDVPGFNDSEGPEVDMANGLGIIRAIQRAKSVKPILVLSKHGMGDRFQALSQTLDTITRLMGENTNTENLKAFSYLFTKYENKYKTLLHKQFASLKKQQKGRCKNGKLFIPLIDDIVCKTNPEARIVSPLDDGAEQLLHQLLSDNDQIGLDPKKTFSVFVSEQAGKDLRLQLSYTKQNLDKVIACKRFDIASQHLQLLASLSEVLPEAKESYADSLQSIQTCLASKQEKISSYAQRVRNSVFSKDLQDLKHEFGEIVLMEPLRVSYHPNEKSSAQVGCEMIQILSAAVGKMLLDFHGRATVVDDFLEQIETLTPALVRFKKIYEVFHDIPEARLVYLQAITVYASLAENVLSAEEACVAKLPGSIERFLHLDAALISMHSQLGLHVVDERAEIVDALFCRRKVLMNQLEQDLSSAADLVNMLTNLMNEEAAKDIDNDCSPISDADFSKADESRVLLLALCDASGKYDLPSDLRVEDMKRSIHSLDEVLFKYLRRLLAHCDITLKRLKEEGIDDILVKQQRIEDLQNLLSFVDCQAIKLRTTARLTPEEAARLSNDVQAVQQALHFYNAKVCDEAEKFSNEVAQISNSARFFLRRLQSSEIGDTVKLLHELCQDERWLLWEDAWKQRRAASENNQKSEKPKKTWSILGMLGFGGNNDTSSGEMVIDDDLDRLLTGILSELNSRIRWASQALYTVDWNRVEGPRLLEFFFVRHSSCIVLAIEFLKLQQQNSALADAIMSQRDPSDVEQGLMLGEKVMTVVLQKVNDICSQAITERKFVDLVEILALLKDNTCVLEAIRAFASTSQTRFNGQDSRVEERRQAFIESIRSCHGYEHLQREAFGAAAQLESQFDALSFLDEERLKTANEHDRLRFYSTVQSNLTKASQAAGLAGYADLEQRAVELQLIYGNAIASVIRETQKIGDHVLSLLWHFAEKPADFHSIYVWVCNLASITATFTNGEEQTIAGRASTLSEQAERIFLERLHLTNSVILADDEDFVPRLMNLKKAAIEICIWRVNINGAIDKILVDASKQSSNSGRFILDLSAKLSSLEDEDAVVAQQILAEHQCFEGAMNAVFNSATARQGIDYVIRGLKIPAGRAVQLKKMYEAFDLEYRELLRAGLLATLDEGVQKRDDFLSSLAIEAKIIASDLSMDYESQIITLAAQLFAYWSLQSINNFFRAHHLDGLDDDCTRFLKKPHAAQVVTVWTMLNYKEPKFQKVESQMCEVKTGEGKSVVLGITATMLALMGCDVSCVCYSEYLSGRDYSDFQSMFQHFDVCQCIKYSTIRGLVFTKIFEEEHVSDHATRVLLGQQRWSTVESSNAGSTPLRFLLVDEVDILFKKDFFGSTCNPVSRLYDGALSELIQHIWENKDNLNDLILQNSTLAKKLVNNFPADSGPLIKSEIGKMLEGARAVSSGTHVKYQIFDGKIGYKKLDGIITNHRCGYETMFAYVKECEAGNISDSTMVQNLYLSPCCGRFSYAELPIGYDAVLGVTGTLKGLCEAEKRILSDVYNINNFSYIPSVYGVNKLQFAADCSRDVILCDTKDDYFLELKAEIVRRQKPANELSSVKRPVMVFFPSGDVMLAFVDSDQMREFKATNPVRVITAAINPNEKDGAFLKATETGAVTFMIREYGRGTDFKCFDNKVLAAGGVHVLQAFYSTDVAEEVQLKGRTARQGADGSFSMVLNGEDLRCDFGISVGDIAKMRNESSFCSFLESRRATLYAAELDKLGEAVKKTEEIHYRTLCFVEAAESNRRQEALKFLFEINGIPISEPKPFLKNDIKQRYVDDHHQRLRDHEGRDRENRRREQELEAESISLLETGDSIHYGILGLPRDASKKDIVRAFRRLSLIYHPDKNSHENAASHFLKIKEAKDVLLCDRKRAAYDASLRIRDGEE